MAFRADLSPRVNRRIRDIAAREFAGSVPRMLEWFADAYDQILAEERDIAPREQALDDREADLDDKEHQMAVRIRQAEEDAIIARRRVGLSESAYELVTSLMEQGVGKPEILSVLRVIQESGEDPAAVADMLARNFGMQEQLQRMHSTIEQGEALRDKALLEAEGAQQSAEDLKRTAEGYAKALEEGARRIAAVKERLQELQEAAREIGIYVDLVGDDRPDKLGARVAMTMAGTILLIAQHEHAELGAVALMSPNQKIGRMIDTPVVISDIVRVLGSDEEYAALRQRIAQRDAVAKRFADQIQNGRPGKPRPRTGGEG